MSGVQGVASLYVTRLKILHNFVCPTTYRLHIPHVVAYVIGDVEQLDPFERWSSDASALQCSTSRSHTFFMRVRGLCRSSPQKFARLAKLYAWFDGMY